MLEQIRYVNHLMQEAAFGDGGMYCSYNELRDYEYSVSTDGGKISSITRDPISKSLMCTIIGDSEKDCYAKRDALYKIIDRDIRVNKPGKLWIGEWYMSCMIAGTKNTEYLEGKYMNTELVVVSDDPTWKKDKFLTFPPASVTPSDYGRGYPHDYSFDYSARRDASQAIINENDYDSDFTLTIFGACQNPRLKIGGHTYGMNCTLLAGESITIDSAKKTVTKLAVDGSEANYMAYRYKVESVFDKIPSGTSALVWDASFGFDLKFIYERSEPPFVR